jgi:hypothetical protein
LSPSARTPEARKFASGVSTSRSFFMCVMKRPPLTENTKPSGVSARHACQLAGFCSA